MFTGIVTAMGSARREPLGGLTVSLPGDFLLDVRVGDSIATQGVCLTVIELGSDSFKAQLSQETLDCSVFGLWAEGELHPVNLEKSLKLSDRLSGHCVLGHVDLRIQCSSIDIQGEWRAFSFLIPAGYRPWIAPKGSVTIDGVSLTVNAVSQTAFTVMLIPHTLAVTTLARLTAGDWVNLEIDLLARYWVNYHENRHELNR